MLDWKKRAGSGRLNVMLSRKSATRRYFGGLFFSRALATLIGIYLLVTMVLWAGTGAGASLVSGPAEGPLARRA
jgi:hypothetical protein